MVEIFGENADSLFIEDRLRSSGSASREMVSQLCFPSIFFGANASIEMDLVLVRLHKTYILAIFFFHLLVEPLIFVSSRVGGRSWNNSAVRPVN
jgi:hypothetical protein